MNQPQDSSDRDVKKTNTIIKHELPVTAPQAVMQTPAQLKKQMAADKAVREIIEAYIKENMVEGKDYGTITIERNGRSIVSKPSLFKPGAEKFCGLFKIRATFKKDPETVEMLGNTPGIIAYICELVDGRGRVVGEGRGTAKTDPETGTDFEINKQVKIAQKRAHIDAVLRTGGLSDFFTQDMEDAPNRESPSNTSTPATANRSFVPASQKQLILIKNLANERFESETDFAEFATETVGSATNLSVGQASNLISELFKVEKMDSDED